MNVIHEHDSAGSAVSILGGARLRRALISIQWRSGLDGVSPHRQYNFASTAETRSMTVGYLDSEFRQLTAFRVLNPVCSSSLFPPSHAGTGGVRSLKK